MNIEDLPGADFEGGEGEPPRSAYGDRPEVTLATTQVVQGAELSGQEVRPGSFSEALGAPAESLVDEQNDGIEVNRQDFAAVFAEQRAEVEPETTSSVQISLWVGSRLTSLEKSWPEEADQSRHAEALRELTLLAEELIEGERL